MKNVTAYILVLIALVSASAIGGFAQTDDSGVKPKTTTKPKSTKPAAPKSNAAKRPPPAKTTPAPKAQKKPSKKPSPNSKPVVLSQLTLRVNQPAAEISIAGNGVAGFAGIRTTTEAMGTPYATELAPGSYTVTVSKPGFVEITREIRAQGKALSEEFELSAAIAYLTITASVPDTQIEVVGVGKFTGGVVRAGVRTGTYRVVVQKRGYVTQTQDVTLSRHGLENKFNFPMARVSVDKQVADAEAALDRGENITAIQFAREVIGIDPVNPRAGRVLGLAMYAVGEAGASTYLIETMRRGETISLPVHYFTKDKELLAANLTIGPQNIVVEVPTKPKANVSLPKFGFKSVNQRLDGVRLRQTAYRGGVVDDKGKTSERDVIFYSQFVFLEKKVPTCTTAVTKCDENATSLYSLLVEWSRPR